VSKNLEGWGGKGSVFVRLWMYQSDRFASSIIREQMKLSPEPYAKSPATQEITRSTHFSIPWLKKLYLVAIELDLSELVKCCFQRNFVVFFIDSILARENSFEFISPVRD
jgi:hypothetical protein